MCADSNSTRFESHNQVTPEPLPEYHHLSDRELLAIIDHAMTAYAFIDYVDNAISELARTDPEQWLEEFGQYACLKTALTAAGARIDAARAESDGAK